MSRGTALVILPMIRGWVEADIAHGSAVMLPGGVMFGRVLSSGGALEPIDCIAVAGDNLDSSSTVSADIRRLRSNKNKDLGVD